MTITFSADTSDIERAERLLQTLPTKIKATILYRATKRVGETMLSRIAQHASDRTKLPQFLFRRNMKVRFGDGSDTVTVKTNWPTRYAQFGGRSRSMQRAGTKLRGSYAHAFVSTMKSGHTGIFQRTTKARLPIEELYGPNIAKHINLNLDEYGKIVEDVADQLLLPRLLHEIGYALGGAD